MNKVWLLVPFLLIAFSCKQEEIKKFDELTQEEQDAIRNASRLKCLSEYTTVYNRFKNQSLVVFDSNSYEREDGFYHELKGPSSTRKVDIRVWKQDRTANEIYFYITENLEGSTNYFLRITQAQNEAMIDQLLIDHCAKTYTTTSGSSGPLNVLFEHEKDNAPNKDYYDDQYTLPFSQLAYFARFNKKRTVETKNEDNVRVGDLVTYTSTLTNKSYDFGSNNNATDSTKYTQNFCEIVVEPTPNVYRFSTDTSVQGWRLNCSGTVPVGWDLTI